MSTGACSGRTSCRSRACVSRSRRCPRRSRRSATSTSTRSTGPRPSATRPATSTALVAASRAHRTAPRPPSRRRRHQTRALPPPRRRRASESRRATRSCTRPTGPPSRTPPGRLHARRRAPPSLPTSRICRPSSSRPRPSARPGLSRANCVSTRATASRRFVRWTGAPTTSLSTASGHAIGRLTATRSCSRSCRRASSASAVPRSPGARLPSARRATRRRRRPRPRPRQARRRRSWTPQARRCRPIRRAQAWLVVSTTTRRGRTSTRTRAAPAPVTTSPRPWRCSWRTPRLPTPRSFWRRSARSRPRASSSPS
eukprot:Unigene6193_Nuclearia_a/m.19055 Unigene6193_Nuclearia_a/g.19055  ORF Unigene6193_Nuclearia_a/g.19055 Unigene6193_Nuclearia_a/m.19055 type:complete len:313 (-) Unigene6193_Nuclearia_a:1961-2899(-)